MSTIEWNQEALGVGVELIDNQHKMLIHLINKLSSAVNNHANHDTLELIFSQLQDYTSYHFETEENYFFRLDDADTALHILQHNKFIEQLATFKQNHQDLSQVSAQLLDFLSDWLINHIQIEDKKFVNNHLASI